jgi:hypothetical protein
MEHQLPLVSGQASGEEQHFNSDSVIRELYEQIMNSVLTLIWAKRKQKR